MGSILTSNNRVKLTFGGETTYRLRGPWHGWGSESWLRTDGA